MIKMENKIIIEKINEILKNKGNIEKFDMLKY